VIITHKKNLVIGDYLIDDSLKNGAAEFPGRHIHFGSEEFRDFQAVIVFLM